MERGSRCAAPGTVLEEEELRLEQAAACHREAAEEMKREFSRTREALDDRKYLDRAKGMIMDQKQLSEQDAYAYLRHLSMDKGISMTELAKMLLKAYEK